MKKKILSVYKNLQAQASAIAANQELFFKKVLNALEADILRLRVFYL